jgi:glycosyltransferase involved in cell wall biosynthesis
VRIGFDMLAVQSPHHGHRGIGRYSRQLVSAMLARDDGHEYYLYTHAALPEQGLPSVPPARGYLRRLEQGRLTASQALERLTRDNPDGLDVLVVLSPFERWSCYHPPARQAHGDGPRLAAVVYDLIPFLFANEHAYDPVLARHYRALEDLKRYDALLAISEATRRDCLRLLGVEDRRVTNIGAASDGAFFAPAPPGPVDESSRSILGGLGITRPFVLNVGGMDERKNLWTLIDAFALLPEALRREHQLVLTFTVLPSDRDRLIRHARAAGLGDALVVTGEVSDQALRVLYQRCAAFVFPSLYEGFGLPLLEALHCGAAVVAGNNSSQPEVVGEAGLLVNPTDAGDIAAKLTRVLQDEALAGSMRGRAAAQSARFAWSETAARASAVLAGLPARRRSASRPRAETRPRLAVFSPFPPRKSGISDYAVALVEALKPDYAIDLFHESGYLPEPALAGEDVVCCDARLFARRAAARDYHAVIYQMGNSRYHRFLYPTMLRHPGIVTLHDFCLAGFHLEYGYRQGCEREHFRAELLRSYPDQAAAIAQVLAGSSWNWEDLGRECARRGWSLNRNILERAERVVVHSPWCLEQVRRGSPEEAAKLEVIPLGSRARRLPTAAERAAIRSRFDLPCDALVVASFGFINRDKLSLEALDAFAPVARSDPSALFVFAGQEADGGAARQRAWALGLADRVRFLGRQPAADYADLIAASDLGINLRRPPTNGETSAALLDLLAAGVASIVTDVATFADYPDAVVRKVRWEARGPDELARALASLAGDRAARERLGRAAHDHVRTHHDWSRVAERYRAVIERCRAERTQQVPPTKVALFGGGNITQPTLARRPAGRSRPRIAFFSPLPPTKSGVSEYSELLLRELKATYAIDLYHETGCAPDPALLEGGFARCDARLFARQAAVRDYRAVVYQMGNSRHHQFLYRTMLRHPGIVTLHDVFLAGFHLHYGHSQGRERKFIRDELLRWYPGQAAAIGRVLDADAWDRERIARDCIERSWYLNRAVLSTARRVVVHSPWCLEQLRRASPEDAGNVAVIPHGIWTRSLPDAQRAAIRDRFGLPRAALVIASFGFVHPDKMSPEAIDAFVPVARRDPSALFVFAGEEADGGAVRRHAEGLGLGRRIRFLGRQPMSDFTDLIAASDLGINLRRPPTHGETSGALLYLLAAGVATIVTDVGTFSDYPDDVVWKVRWESEGPAGLQHALNTLAADRAARAALGRAAQAYTRAHHAWSRVAEQYVDVIERCRTSRAG